MERAREQISTADLMRHRSPAEVAQLSPSGRRSAAEVAR